MDGKLPVISLILRAGYDLMDTIAIKIVHTSKFNTIKLVSQTDFPKKLWENFG